MLPYTKRKSLDEAPSMKVSSSNTSLGMGGGMGGGMGKGGGGGMPSMSECIRMGGGSSSSSGGGGGELPSVMGNRAGGGRALGGAGGGGGGELPSVTGLRGLRQLQSESSCSALGQEDDVISFQGGGGYAHYGIDYNNTVGKNDLNDQSSFAHTQQQLPNTIVQSSGGRGGFQDLADEEEAERERRARKRQVKAEKRAKQQQLQEQEAAAQAAAAGQLENGSGMTAGPLTDWGWANEQAQSAAVLSGQQTEAEPEYSDDEDFEAAGDRAGGGKRGTNKGSGNNMPSINKGGMAKGKEKKKGGGLSLPSI